METLAFRAARAAQWRVAGSLIVAGSQFTAGVLLARLLPPPDFGLMAMTVVALGFVQTLGELGIGAAVVQRAILTERHVRAAFTASMLLGVIVSVAVAAAAPWVADALRDVRVTPLLQVLAGTFAIRSIGVVASAILRRQLDFRRHFFIDAGSSLAGSAVAVMLALTGYGVWSLVWGSVVQVLFASSAQLAAARHALRPLIARPELADLFTFGFGSAASGLVNYVARNADNFVVGRWLGATSLGMYDRAYALMNLPFTYMSGAIASVLFPAFALVQSEPERLRRGYLATTRVTAMVAGPLMGMLAVAAPHLVPALYGERWSAVSAPLQVLCAAGYFRALYHLGGVVVQSVGRVYSELALQAGYALLVVGGSVAAWRFGLEGVAAAVGAAIVCMFFATGAVALRIAAISWRDYFRVQRPAFVTTGVTGAAALAARFVLEDRGQSGGIVALAVAAAAAVPWSIGLLRMLGEPECEALRLHLPVWCRRVIDRNRRLLVRAQEVV